MDVGKSVMFACLFQGGCGDGKLINKIGRLCVDFGGFKEQGKLENFLETKLIAKGYGKFRDV